VRIRWSFRRYQTYSLASLAALFLSSSLYLVAAPDVYFVLGSLLFSAAEPPLDWKNLVADSLPPTFMTRSWSHCHSVRWLARARAASWGVRGRRTVEVGRPDKGNVDAEVAVVGGAIEAQIDAQGDGRPGRVLLAAVEADLGAVSMCRQSRRADTGRLALFAGFDLSFSKILSDCCLDARPLILTAFSAGGRGGVQVRCARRCHEG